MARVDTTVNWIYMQTQQKAPPPEFSRIDDALDWCRKQPDALAALKQLVDHNFDMGEYGCAADLLREADTL